MAKTGNKPGVTRGNQWINVGKRLQLLDTPGILWPKFEDETIGLHLAFTGAVRDAIMDVETLAYHLIQLLAQRKPEPYGVPDAAYFYNNINYALLASVVERASRQHFEDFFFVKNVTVYAVYTKKEITVVIPINVGFEYVVALL